MTIEESIIARIAYALGKEASSASSRDQALAIERFVLQYRPDKPCEWKLKCVLNSTCCNGDRVCNN